MTCWGQLQDKPPTAPSDILCQSIWFNPSITVASKPVFYKNWCQAGVFHINDLLDDTGNIFTPERLFNNYNTIPKDHLEFYSVISAIPKTWKGQTYRVIIQ